MTKNRKEFFKKISLRLSNAIESYGISQEALCQECRKNGIIISQTDISRIVNYHRHIDENNTTSFSTSSLSLINVAYICKVLNIDINKLLFGDESHFDSFRMISDIFSSNSSVFATNVTDKAFKGYIGKYHCYYLPTISIEKKPIHAILNIEKDSISDECNVTLSIYTNKSGSKQENVKEYKGRMIISTLQDACYCIVCNPEYGEIGMINFFHRYFLTSEVLQCRIAAALTTSAGDRRRPTVHRMLLCRREINDSELNLIIPQLLLNSNEIIFPKSAIESILKNNEAEAGHITLILDQEPTHEYYRIHEDTIMNLEDIPIESRFDILCALRNHSVNLKNSKIGTKADELVYNRLFPPESK